jgi:hypothetical protein
MRARRLVVLLGLYVSLHLANPLMPGVFNFGAHASTDGVPVHCQEGRPRTAAIPAPPAVRGAAPTRPLVAFQPADRPAISEWFVDPRQRQSPSSEPAPTEDHGPAVVRRASQ